LNVDSQEDSINPIKETKKSDNISISLKKMLNNEIFKKAPSNPDEEESISYILSVNELWKKELCIHFVNGDNRNGHLDKSWECGFAHGEAEKCLWDSFRKDRKLIQKI
jgi:hypothetical protein